MALAEQIDIITEFTQRLQVAVIGAEETTDKYEKWVEGTETETIPTANGPLKTLRGQIAEWRLSSDSSVQQVIDSYSLTFEQKMDQFDDDFVNYLLTIGFEPAVLYGPGILLERRAQTVAFNGVTYYWGGTLPYTTTGDFGTEPNWLIAPIIGGVEVPQMSFASGGNIVRKTQSVLGADGEWYYWTGTFPKLIAPGSTVESAGGVGQNKFKLSSGVVPLRPLMKIVASAAGMPLNPGSFEYGATITSNFESLVQLGTGKLWRWVGTLPKVVDINSSPLSAGGVGATLWVEINSGDAFGVTEVSRIKKLAVEALRKTYAEAGLNLVEGSFEQGGTLNSNSEVLLHETQWKAYSWGGLFPKDVVGGATPAPIGGTTWSDASNTNGRAQSIHSVMALMASGSEISLAFFGNSTTDGFGTTGWTANPTISGDAVGNSNHNLNSPNSYPTLLEGTLRDMFDNDNIKTFNAGYSGKSLIDGWAFRNYETAIINNPFYGIPTVVFIDFGLNDVRPSGSQVELFSKQLTALVMKIRSYGSIPVILTCDPIVRNYDAVNAVYNREVVTEIDEVKREVSETMGVPLLDKGSMLRDWANNNNDGFRWFVEQSSDLDGDGDYGSGDDVGLHFNNQGHLIKSQIIAKSLFPLVVEYTSGSSRITSNDARAKCFGNFLLTLSGDSETNSVQGMNFKVDFYDPNPSHRPSGVGAPMTTIWVWNESTSCDLIYRGLVGEGWGTNDTDNPVLNPSPPKISVSTFGQGSTEFIIPSVGFRYSGFFKPSDVPYTITRLKYGLNKITYLCGDFSQYNRGNLSLFFYGFFELTDNSCSRSQERRILDVSANTGLLDCFGFNRSFGVVDNKRIVFILDVELPIGCGVSLLSSSTFSGMGVGVEDGYGSVQSSVVYRQDSSRVRLAVAKRSVTNQMIMSPIDIAVPVTFDNNRVKLRVEIMREYGVNDFGSGMQIVKLYDGLSSIESNLVQEVSIPTSASVPFHFGGQIGGFYADAVLNEGGTIIVHSLESSIL